MTDKGKWVPEEPTGAMLKAGHRAREIPFDPNKVYRAMLAAAPPQAVAAGSFLEWEEDQTGASASAGGIAFYSIELRQNVWFVTVTDWEGVEHWGDKPFPQLEAAKLACEDDVRARVASVFPALSAAPPAPSNEGLVEAAKAWGVADAAFNECPTLDPLGDLMDELEAAEERLRQALSSYREGN